jgi:hypothetical protein
MMMRGFLTFCCVSRSEVFAKNVSAFAENVSVYFLGGHVIYCFISLKPASTVFPPNCHSNFQFGVKKSLWESRSMTTLASLDKPNADISAVAKCSLNKTENPSSPYPRALY